MFRDEVTVWFSLQFETCGQSLELAMKYQVYVVSYEVTTLCI